MKPLSKILSLILCFSMLFSFPFFVFAEEEYDPAKGEFVFSSEDMLSYMTQPYSVDLKFDTNEKAMKMTVNNDNGGIDPRALLDMSSLGLKASDFGSLLIIYRVPQNASAAAHATELFISAGSVTAPAAGKSVMYNISKSNTFTSHIVDLSALSWWSGNIHSIRIDPFTNASVGDSMYIDSVILCKNYSEAISKRDTRIAELNKIDIPDYANSDYICTEYEYDKYTSPMWKGNIVYNEAVYPIQDKDGNSVYTLMYTPDDIISVYTSDFTSLYYEGIDYTVEGNKITFLNSGSISLTDYYYIHPKSNPNGYSWDRYYNRTAAGDGKWEYWGQSPEFFNGYINVTYTHSDTWDHYVPEQKSSELPITAKRIENKQSMNVVFFGDSICGGANSSSYRKVYPYAEYWNEMIVSKLRYDYGLKINPTYSSEGGGAAPNLVSKTDAWVTAHKPDLVFIEFGVNDAMNWSQDSSGSASGLKREFKSAITEMIAEVRDTYPNCEFVLVAPFYSNIYCHYMSYFEACRDALNEIAASHNGVVVADITAMHSSLLEFKDYLDFSGDNMCHPNDYMARLYAQVCLETIVPGGVEPYTVDEEPPVAEPDTGNTTSAAPSGYGWQWNAKEAYGYIKNYGQNSSDDIIFTTDLALISSTAEEAEARFYVDQGQDIIITPTHVSIAGRIFAYDWGVADISNWHTVTIIIKDGSATVLIDGEIAGMTRAGYSAFTEHILFFSYLGCMAIDNMSLSDSTGKVYFECDFEDKSLAEKYMGEGYGEHTILAANTVFYDTNGGEGEIKNQIKVRNIPLTLSDALPKREGYTFLGWSTDKNAIVAEYTSSSVYSAEKSITLYAVWEKEVSEIVVGDADGDGKVNAKDVNMLKRVFAGVISLSEQSKRAADLNLDGTVNAYDANILSRMISGTADIQ